ncbi:hypothetical protein ACIP69_18230 [Streptomyces hygroscopicus]|uniref:hypothetical protein n=1 Tax=Streptomyces hygroscopicus TaxID=1912 RepID=UPI00381F9BB7
MIKQNARAALATIGTSPSVRILSVTQIDTALIVATEQPDRYFRYAVDTFRLPRAAETDPNQVDPREPGEWILVDQHGDHTDQVARMLADAAAYLAEIGITAENTPIAA